MRKSQSIAIETNAVSMAMGQDKSAGCIVAQRWIRYPYEY